MSYAQCDLKSELDCKIKRLEGTISCLDERNVRLIEQNKELQAENAKLQFKIDGIKGALDSRWTEDVRIRGENGRLAKELRASEVLNSARSDIIVAEQHDIKKLQAENTKLKMELESTETVGFSCDFVNTMHEEARVRIVYLDQINEDLKEELTAARLKFQRLIDSVSETYWKHK